MRHRKFSQRLSRQLGHRRATLRNLTISLLKHQRIRTTGAKAKLARRFAERLISLAKRNTLQARRSAFKTLNNRAAVGRLFSQIAPLFANRSSGFTRIIRLGNRRGDGAQLVLLELTEKLKIAKPEQVKKVKSKKEETPSKETGKPAEEIRSEQKTKPPKERPLAPRKLKPKKFLGGLRRLFKKERDSL